MYYSQALGWVVQPFCPQESVRPFFWFDQATRVSYENAASLVCAKGRLGMISEKT